MTGYRSILLSSAMLAFTAGGAAAGGIEWLSPSDGVGLLFEKGRQVQFTLQSVSPHVSGNANPVLGGAASGNMTKNYTPYSLGIKMPLSPNLDFAFIVDSSVGADVAYPAGTGYPFANSSAKITSTEFKALLKYRFPSNFSVYGGVRMDRAKGSASLNAPLFGVNNYHLNTQSNDAFGYLLGVAYEKPDIALRVALTYTSPITHKFRSTESGVAGLLITAATANGTFSTTVPKAWTLDFQTGVAPKTLLFGSVEWRQWTKFNISPPNYSNPGLPYGALVSYSHNTVTWNLGLGRQFTDTWSGAVSLGYEKSNGGIAGNLGPTDGYKSIGVAAIYTHDKMKITTGVSYIKIGNATTSAGTFSGNHAIGVGVKVGYSF